MSFVAHITTVIPIYHRVNPWIFNNILICFPFLNIDHETYFSPRKKNCLYDAFQIISFTCSDLLI